MRKGKPIQIYFSDDEFLWLGRYAGPRKISEVIRELVRKLRKKQEYKIKT